MTPIDQDAGSAQTIRFAIGQSVLGRVLVASSDQGLRAIWFGDDDDALTRALFAAFPGATPATDSGYGGVVAKIVRYIDTPGTELDLPLDIRGTGFQKDVWAALRQIPSGVTASYADVARRVGFPKGAREVAEACAANDLAVIIPCHRVVKIDGSLSGYRWGARRKRALLKREEAAA